MKRFIYLLFTSLFVISIIIFNPPSKAYAESLKIEGYTYEDMDILKGKIDEYNGLMDAALKMANAGRALGYEETHEVIQLAKDEYANYKKEKDTYISIYSVLMRNWESKRNEFPEATQVWEYLKDAGYSKYVCAGILGNIMTEVGGNTLAIQPLIETTEYYGMCQWSSYYPDAWGLSLEEQCDFLLNTINNEFVRFGKLYNGGIKYAQFKEMTDCQAVALCFAKVYEKCSSSSYTSRKDNAVTAYNYFVS